MLRRIVTVDDSKGKSWALSDDYVKDVLFDPARPGFSSARVWITDATPARGCVIEPTESIPQSLEPPPCGSVFRVMTIPPDVDWVRNCTRENVHAWFAAAGSPAASRYGADAPHPYMQRTATLDLCVVLEGEVTLVLDTEKVSLAAGDVVVQRGTSHAWSNHSDKPAVIAVSSHDAWDPA
jgi:hypothetical protein